MKIAYTSDVGQVRQVNEDRVATFKNKAGFSFAIVADGLGGHLGGEVASEMAVFPPLLVHVLSPQCWLM